MATVNAAQAKLDETGDTIKFTWALTTANEVGSPIPGRYSAYGDRTVYVVGGTWGGATLVWQGGDSSTYVSLTDPQGNAISKTADFIEAVTEVPEFSRPLLSVVGAGASITVTCIARRGFRRT